VGEAAGTADAPRRTDVMLNPYAGKDVAALLDARAAALPEQPYLMWEPPEGDARTWTYGRFAAETASVAAGLAARGVRAGDRVLVHLDNCPEFLLAWFACARLGAVAVTTNTHSAGDELAYYADDSAAVGAITQPRYAELVAAHASRIGWLVSTDDDAGSAVAAGTRPDRASSFASLFADAGGFAGRTPDPGAPMSVQYTSGTTSRPKGVLWTHANALWGAQVNAAHEDLRVDDVHYVYLPLFHTNALAYSVLASLWAGSSLVLVPKWSTSRFWDLSVRHRCTWISLIAFAYKAMLAMEVPPGNRSRHFGTGVCDLPTDAHFGVKTIGWWGMTETISHGIIGDARLPNRPMSMGRPAPEYGIAVVRDDGSPVEPGETGRLLVRGIRGLSLFAEYLNQPDATAAAFDGDWFDTGDLVTPGDDGHVDFADRAKDMLKVGAENVAASEIERVILGVPGVVEAAVVGRPHDMLDEVPVAFVIAPGAGPALADAIVSTCAEKLASFKVPTAVHVVDELPRATLDKVNKAELRRMIATMATAGDAETR
jgi:crotonobetaine/carnitine-CoA ligase